MDIRTNENCHVFTLKNLSLGFAVPESISVDRRHTLFAVEIYASVHSAFVFMEFSARLYFQALMAFDCFRFINER